MDREFFGMVVLGIVAVIATSWVLPGPKTRREAVRARLRRGGGNALLTLEEFIAPRVEHVIQARQQPSSPLEEAGDALSEVSEAQIRAELEEALARNPVDREEVRRHLALALAAGMDWRGIYRDAVGRELAIRPYRAPFLPPVARVTPLREIDEPASEIRPGT